MVSVLLVAALAGALQGSDLGAARSSGSSAALNAEPMGQGPSSPTLPTPIQHVFLIMMENEQTGMIYGEQPYQTKLANTYAWGGDANSNPDHAGYYAICHPSAPNYLALTSGQPLQCNSDAFSTYSVNNLGNLLDEAGLPWVGWRRARASTARRTTARTASMWCATIRSRTTATSVDERPVPRA